MSKFGKKFYLWFLKYSFILPGIFNYKWQKKRSRDQVKNSSSKTRFNGKKSFMRSNRIFFAHRKRQLKQYVWSIALYGCGDSRLSQGERKQLDLLELWRYLIMMKVSWVKRENNYARSNLGNRKNTTEYITKGRDTFIYQNLMA